MTSSKTSKRVGQKAKLAAALKANLARRKKQAKARKAPADGGKD